MLSRHEGRSADKPTPYATDALPDLDVTACSNEDGSEITVFIVNRSLEEVKTQLRLDHCKAAGEMVLHEITGDSFDDINSVFEPERIVCKTKSVSSADWQDGLSLRPHSVYAASFKVMKQ